MQDFIEVDRKLVGNVTHDFLLGSTEHRVQTNYFFCGIGKDYAFKQTILYHWTCCKGDYENQGYLRDQFCIAIPTHRMAKGLGNLEEFFNENEIPFTHLYGKQHFCTEPEGFSYNDGTCQDCPFHPSKEPETLCSYYNQKWEEYVVIMPFEHVPILPMRQIHAKRRLLIYDEIPFRVWMRQIFIPPTLDWTVNIEDVYDVELGAKDRFYNFSDDVNITCGLLKNDIERRFKPVGVKQYEYYLFLLQNKNNHIYAQISDKGTQLFAFNDHLAPRNYDRVLVNCGTTPVSVRRKMFDDDIIVKKGFSKVINPRIYIGSSWCKDTTIKYINDFIEFIKAFEGKIFIATKKGETNDDESKWIEKRIRVALPDIDMVHYGEIGTNEYNREYDAAILYGDFHYIPVTRYKLQKRLTIEEIRAMEDSVVEQAIHRCRLLLHENTLLIVMSNKGLRGKTIHMFPRKTMIMHGTHKLKSLPTHTWGEDNGLSSRSTTNYRHFLTTISRFFSEVWTETDIICNGMEKGWTNAQIAEEIGKSVRTVSRLRNKIKRQKQITYLECLDEENEEIELNEENDNIL